MTRVTLALPTFSRLRKLIAAAKSISTIRYLEYELFRSLDLTGLGLDYGGGKTSRYSDQIDHWGQDKNSLTLESANIDQSIEPTHIISEDGVLPVSEFRYDFVVSLNTFEHIFDMERVLEDIFRVLKKGGELVFAVPFIFRVHGHPDDYSRHTASYWQRMLESFGFNSVEVTALTWGPISTSMTIAGPIGPGRRIRFIWAYCLDFLYLKKKFGNLEKVRDVQDAPVFTSPLGYAVRARK
jgi:SAM-dependent methyltransferase